MLNKKSCDLLTTGLSIFAMFFGAGNIIFPLVLGQQLALSLPFALLGLLITAVVIPFSGLLTLFFYEGNLSAFFGRFGKKKGLFVALFLISLLGPFGSTPRCIALAFSTFQLSFPLLNPYLFNAVACFCLFLMSYKKHQLLNILGYFLTPLLVLLLIVIIIKGFGKAPILTKTKDFQPIVFSLMKGIKEGYHTMDLLAAFFFAPLILSSTQSRIKHLNPENRFYFILKASAIGALCLGLVYSGFCYLAAFYSPSLQGVSPDQLLGTLALQILGPYAGIFVCLTVVLACLTTAIALISAFTEFIHREIFKKKGKENFILLGAVILTYVIACFEFQGISKFLAPILELCYPLLILLTFYNLAEYLFKIQAQRKVKNFF